MDTKRKKQKIQNLSVRAMRTGALRLLLAQSAATVVLGIIMASWNEIPVVYSVLVGGFICIVSNGFFMYRFFTYHGARAASCVVCSMYWGEFVKLLLVGVLMSIALIYGHVSPLPCLLSYLVVYHVYFLSPWLFREERVSQ